MSNDQPFLELLTVSVEPSFTSISHFNNITFLSKCHSVIFQFVPCLEFLVPQHIMKRRKAKVCCSSKISGFVSQACVLVHGPQLRWCWMWHSRHPSCSRSSADLIFVSFDSDGAGTWYVRKEVVDYLRIALELWGFKMCCLVRRDWRALGEKLKLHQVSYGGSGELTQSDGSGELTQKLHQMSYGGSGELTQSDGSGELTQSDECNWAVFY